MTNYAKHNKIRVGTTNDNSVRATVGNVEEVELFVEELEQVIAPISGIKK